MMWIMLLKDMLSQRLLQAVPGHALVRQPGRRRGRPRAESEGGLHGKRREPMMWIMLLKDMLPYISVPLSVPRHDMADYFRRDDDFSPITQESAQKAGNVMYGQGEEGGLIP